MRAVLAFRAVEVPPRCLKPDLKSQLLSNVELPLKVEEPAVAIPLATAHADADSDSTSGSDSDSSNSDSTAAASDSASGSQDGGSNQ